MVSKEETKILPAGHWSATLETRHPGESYTHAQCAKYKAEQLQCINVLHESISVYIISTVPEPTFCAAFVETNRFENTLVVLQIQRRRCFYVHYWCKIGVHTLPPKQHFPSKKYDTRRRDAINDKKRSTNVTARTLPTLLRAKH